MGKPFPIESGLGLETLSDSGLGLETLSYRHPRPLSIGKGFSGLEWETLSDRQWSRMGNPFR